MSRGCFGCKKYARRYTQSSSRLQPSILQLTLQASLYSGEMSLQSKYKTTKKPGYSFSRYCRQQDDHVKILPAFLGSFDRLEVGFWLEMCTIFSRGPDINLNAPKYRTHGWTSVLLCLGLTSKLTVTVCLSKMQLFTHE